MTDMELNRVLETIYASFGRTRPAKGTPIYAVIAKKTQDVPDAAADFITSAISDLDTIPTNMGKAIYAKYLAWLEAHPEFSKQKAGCPECREGWLWFFSSRRPFGCVVKCPRCSGGDAEVVEKYRRAGVDEMPVDFRGSPTQYGVWRGYIRQRSDDDIQPGMPDTAAALETVGKKPRHDDRREAVLTEWEQADYAVPWQ